MPTRFKPGDQVVLAKKNKKLYLALHGARADAVHIVMEVVEVDELPFFQESDRQSVGHPQWLRTNLHPDQISGAFFSLADRREAL